MKSKVQQLYERWRCIFGETDRAVNELGYALELDGAELDATRPTAAELEHAAAALERGAIGTGDLLEQAREAGADLNMPRAYESLGKHAATLRKVAAWLRETNLRE